jgi:hypothetical protein
MNLDLEILKSIAINSKPSNVLDVLINPEKINQYFTGAKIITDWQIVSEIIFNHIYEEQEFKKKGVILHFNQNHLLSYAY